uniref:N-acetyltransferase domain-containing protein n=1 Tax=Chaetoceros debilis TaxID=122233 RepID=A0A7S3QAR0_9STRA
MIKQPTAKGLGISSFFLRLAAIFLLVTSPNSQVDALVQIPTAATVIRSESSSRLDLERIPFFVQQLKENCNKADCEAISSLTIDVFFREEAELLPENRTGGSITKPLILAYLKNLQYGDVKGKKFMLSSNTSNSMFVARRLVKYTGSDDNSNSLDQEKGKVGNGNIINGNNVFTIAELSEDGSVFNIYNKNCLPEDCLSDPNARYTTENVLGFVDVTEKNFGIANEDASSNLVGFEESTTMANGENTPVRRKSAKREQRPVLTNLSVAMEARCSGVGSALVDACENAAMEEWARKFYEMVLEVEEENIAAQKFYEKRGYIALFADPTSRRYDTSGFVLKNERTTKICYRKDLTLKRASSASQKKQGENGNGIADMFFAKVKSVFGMN